MIRNNSIRNIIADPEFWTLLMLNLWLVFAYKYGKIGPSTIIFIYYCQSLMIGIFHFIRLSVYPEYDNPEGKKFFPAWFFAIHYGGFHFVYFIFLMILIAGMGHFPSLHFSLMVLSGFAINGILSLLSLIKEDRLPHATSKGALFFLPYLRIIPMHVFIILGWKSFGADGLTNYQFSFLLFIGLKTLSDVLMHILTNKTWRQRRPRVFGTFI